MSETAKPKYAEYKNAVQQVYYGVAEKTFQESAYVPETQLKPFNPDDLWQKDNSYEIYEDMLKDDQISQNMAMKKDLVVGSGFDIITYDDSHDEIKKDLERALYDDVEFPFEEQLEDMLSCYDFGVSIGEKIFHRRKDGTLGLRKIKVTHPDTWLIYTDEMGNVEKYEQRGVNKDIEVDAKTLLHYVNNRKFQNVYGRSDLRPAFQAWITKREITKFLAIFLEKYASPIPVGKYDEKTPRADVDALFRVLRKFQQKTAITVPKELELEFLQASASGSDSYIAAINLFNTFISRALFIPDLLGFSGSETNGGSYSLGEKQLELFLNHIRKRRRTLEQLINFHIIRPLVLFNYGEVENHPEFKFKPISNDNAIEFARVWIEAQKLGAYKPTEAEINHMLHSINFPENEEMELKGDEPGLIGMPPRPPAESLSPAAASEPEEEMEVQENKAAEEPKQYVTKIGTVFKLPEGDYHKKVDFDLLANQLDVTERTIVSEYKPLMDLAIDDLYEQIRKKRILETKDTSRIASLKLKNKKQLQKILKTNLLECYAKAKNMAKNEIFKETIEMNFAQAVPEQVYLDVLEQSTFDYIKDWEYRMINGEIAVELRQAILNGSPLQNVINNTQSRLKDMGEVSINRYARTATTDVVNRARQEFFSSSQVVQGYQYSALIDGQTTDVCRGLDGKKFKKGTEPIPPMHFNCRSVLIPITVYEEYTPDKAVGSKSIDQFIADNAGKGFGRKE